MWKIVGSDKSISEDEKGGENSPVERNSERRLSGSDSDESKYRILFETSSDAVMMLGKQHFTDCNSVTLQMFGREKKEDLLVKHPADVSPPTQAKGNDSRSKANERIETAFEKGTNKFEWIHRRAKGEDFPAMVWLTTFSIDGKQVIRATVRDLIERKKAEGAQDRDDKIFRSVNEASERFLTSSVVNGEENVLKVLKQYVVPERKV